MFIEYNPSVNVINVSEVTIEVRHDLSAMKPLKIQWYSRITLLNMSRGKLSGTDESFVLHRPERSLIKYILHYLFFFSSLTHIILADD